MRAFAGLLIATGVVVAVLSFFYTVGGGEVRLWPGVTVGVSIAAPASSCWRSVI